MVLSSTLRQSAPGRTGLPLGEAVRKDHQQELLRELEQRKIFHLQGCSCIVSDPSSSLIL